MKKQVRKLLVGAACLLACATGSIAGDTDTQQILFDIQVVNELVVDQASVTLTVNTATGGVPDDAFDDATTYDVTTNESDKKITVALDSDLPAGLTLEIDMEAPTGASSSPQNLSTAAVDAVTGISQVSESDLIIAYTLSVDDIAVGNVSGSRTATFTLVDE